LGFVRSIKNSGLYILRKDTTFLFLALYIDDSFLFSYDLELISKVKIVLSSKYEMIDLRDLYSGLNQQVIRDRDNKILSFSQSKYTQKKLEEFNLNYAKSITTPLEPKNNMENVNEITQKEEPENEKGSIQISSRPC
jgi:hypothetical protein